MATAPVEQDRDGTALLSSVRTDLLDFADVFAAHFLLQGSSAVADTVAAIEEVSKVVEHLQILGAHALQQGAASAGEGSRPGSAAGTAPAAALAGVSALVKGPGEPREFRNTADFLRARLRISRSEANRRLRLAGSTRPRLLLSGEQSAPPLEILGEALGSGSIGGRAASLIRDAVERVRPVAEPEQLEYMERHLTRQAVESDEDILRAVARRWENALDQDGQEPSEKVLQARQGVFIRGRRNGLHYLEIGATDDQFEHLVTVMNTATNPRLPGTSMPGGGPGLGSTSEKVSDGTDGPDTAVPAPGRWDSPTRPQQLLEGLVSACRIALAGDGLPAAGGHRPQVMVTIDYRTLLGDLLHARGADRAGAAGRGGSSSYGSEAGTSGDAVFVQQISARSIRRIACDADILPLVLGGKGQILDIGRSQRLFPPHLRRALVARDKGCAFPDCTIPSTWCEAHHILPWGKGGTTNIRDGVLLCSRHHHVIHEGSWSVQSRHGIPWFRPPRHLDPQQKLRRNRYWSAGESVQAARLHPG